MEVTKYYCELCDKEIKYKEWTEIVIAIRQHTPHTQDTISHSKKICDSCMKELGLIQSITDPLNVERKIPIRKLLQNRFKNIIKRLV